MITLLSEKDSARVRVEYRLRLFAIGAALFAGVFVAAAVALLPSYVTARLAGSAAEQENKLLSQAIDSSALASAGKSVRSAQALLAAITFPAGAPRPSEVIAALAGVRHKGITITRAEFSSQPGHTQVRLSGVAATRDGLLQFRQALAGIPGVSSVGLPIENLAKASDIDYGMTIDLRPPPKKP